MVDLNTVGAHIFAGDISRCRLWRTIALLISGAITALALATHLNGLARTLIAGSALTVMALLSAVFLLGRQETIDHAASQAD